MDANNRCRIEFGMTVPEGWELVRHDRFQRHDGLLMGKNVVLKVALVKRL